MLATPDTPRDERALVAALRAGDELAYAELHERYHDRLVAVAISQGCSPAGAHEVAQETWTAVVRGIHAFEGRSSVKTWIFRIAVNAAHAQVARERRFVPAAPEVIELAGWSRSPHEVAVWRETVQKVRAAIADLGQMQREVIVLRDVYGWSAEEVAERLGISAVHERVLLHRGRAAVVKALEGYLDAEELRAA